MARCMKGGGGIIKQMEEEGLLMPMGMFMMVSGLMIWRKGLVYIVILMDQSMKGNGHKINSMAMDQKLGLMVPGIKGSMFKV